MLDLEGHIRTSGPAKGEVTPLDLAALHQRARRRQHTRTATIVGASLVLALAVGVGTQSLLGPAAIRIDDTAAGDRSTIAETRSAEPDSAATRHRKLRGQLRAAEDHRMAVVEQIADIERRLPAANGPLRAELQGRLDQLLYELEQVDRRIGRLSEALDDLHADHRSRRTSILDVVGLQEDRARDALERAGFTVISLAKSTSDRSQSGTVLDQSPTAGPIIVPEGDAPDARTVVIQVGSVVE